MYNNGIASLVYPLDAERQDLPEGPARRKPPQPRPLGGGRRHAINLPEASQSPTVTSQAVRTGLNSRTFPGSVGMLCSAGYCLVVSSIVRF